MSNINKAIADSFVPTSTGDVLYRCRACLRGSYTWATPLVTYNGTLNRLIVSGRCLAGDCGKAIYFVVFPEYPAPARRFVKKLVVATTNFAPWMVDE